MLAMKTSCARLTVLFLLALPPTAWAQRGDAVYVEDRLNQIQQSLTTLTGQLEQMQYRNQQLQQQMEKMQADYEYRLDTLEKGGKAGPRPAAPTPSSGPTPTPAGGGNLAASAPPAGGGPQGEALYHDAFKHLQDGDYAGAEQGFKTFVQRNPQHVLAGNAQYWLGETYYARRDYQNAMVAFAEGYKTYKTSPKGPDNLLKLGVTLAVLNKKPEACAVFARFNQDYPRATDLQKRRIDQERQKNGCG
jgi:tol-pal system protein YbgF